MATYKTITIKKKGGGTRTQRVQVLASGKYKFVKNTGKKISKKLKSTKKQVTTQKRVRSYMARRRKRRTSRKFTLPMALVVPIAWKFESATRKMINGYYEGAMKDLLWHFACIDQNMRFNPEALKTWLPVLIGGLVHKFVGGAPLNVNRKLKDVPIIRI